MGIETGLTPRQRIERAIAAHTVWNFRLLSALEAGTADFDIPSIRVDNGCELGKWLHEGAAAWDDRNGHCARVIALHARFHLHAAGVLELVRDGHQAAAEDSIRGGLFNQSSLALLAELKAWCNAVTEAETQSAAALAMTLPAAAASR